MYSSCTTPSPRLHRQARRLIVMLKVGCERTICRGPLSSRGHRAPAMLIAGPQRSAWNIPLTRQTRPDSPGEGRGMRAPDQIHVVAGHVIGGDGSGGVAVPAQVRVFPSSRGALGELGPRAVHDLDFGQHGRVVDHLAKVLMVDDPRLEVTGLEEGDAGVDGTVGDVLDLAVDLEDLEQTLEAPDGVLGRMRWCCCNAPRMRSSWWSSSGAATRLESRSTLALISRPSALAKAIRRAVSSQT